MSIKRKVPFTILVAALMLIASRAVSDAWAASARVRLADACYECIGAGGAHYFNTIAQCEWGSWNCRHCDDSFHVGEGYCHENAVEGACTVHQLCALERPALLSMTEALSKGRTADAKRLLTEHNRAFHINIERGLVQFLDCQGGVAGQIAVTSDVAATLRSAQLGQSASSLYTVFGAVQAGIWNGSVERSLRVSEGTDLALWSETQSDHTH